MFTPNQRPESYSLNVHFNGLSHLYLYVKGEERKRLEEQPNMMFFTPFGDRGDIILNHFIWYSNSLLPLIDCPEPTSIRRRSVAEISIQRDPRTEKISR